jgi:Tol biopolymer transport system component
VNGRRVRRALVAAAAATAIAGGASASQAAGPALIVFSADRAPQLSGEIYRIDSTGRSVDLSNDTAAVDTDPVVSPDGKQVAFISNRSGQWGVYEVRIDGSGVKRVAALPISEGAQLAWQPHGGLLAVGTGGVVLIVGRGGTVVHVPNASRVYGWSPDGRVLVTESVSGTNSYHALAVSPRGRKLWRIKIGGRGSGVWSARGLLALNTGGTAVGSRQTIAVYNEGGHLRFKVWFSRIARIQTSWPWSAWSPNGSRLALAYKRALQVDTATGRVLLRKRLNNSDLQILWDGNSHIVLAGYGSCNCHARSVDVPTGKTSAASDRFALNQTSADGKLAILKVPAGDEFQIQVAPTAGGSPQTYTQVPACDTVTGQRYADFGAAQFVRGNRSIVYASTCRSPALSLYSVSADGGAVHRITTSHSMYWSPALSPDGSKIAFVGNPCAGLGCGEPSSGIGVLNADGTGEHMLTSPPNSSSTCSGNYDSSPTWSPDGATILFGRNLCGGGTGMAELYTVPASGGAVHDLGFRAYEVAWGPSKIAYVGLAPSGEPAGTFIWTAKPDGTDAIPIAGSSGARSPAWSPNGQLAYLRNNGRTVVVDSSQSTFPFATVVALAWSPDGTRLVVTARATATAPVDVYTVNPNGSDPIRLTQNYDAGGVTWR